MSPAINLLLPILTVSGQVFFVILLFAIFLQNKFVLLFVKKNATLIAFIVATFATLGSLYYSEIMGYEPCKLCWIQRIFMYPQVILLGLALIKKETIVSTYNSIVLSILGGLVAGYHYLLQIGAVPNLPCSAVGYSVSCSQRFVLEFGYLTIPMMALTAFAVILLTLITSRLNRV